MDFPISSNFSEVITKNKIQLNRKDGIETGNEIDFIHCMNAIEQTGEVEVINLTAEDSSLINADARKGRSCK